MREEDVEENLDASNILWNEFGDDEDDTRHEIIESRLDIIDDMKMHNMDTNAFCSQETNPNFPRSYKNS